ncbi:hypothetical protein ACTFIT_000719 [Dictyostelium discoideum]
MDLVERMVTNGKIKEILPKLISTKQIHEEKILFLINLILRILTITPINENRFNLLNDYWQMLLENHQFLNNHFIETGVYNNLIINKDTFEKTLAHNAKNRFNDSTITPNQIVDHTRLLNGTCESTF